MKYLPCSTCHGPARATKSGILHTAGQLLDSSIRYLCAACGRSNILSSAEFARLPEMTAAQIADATCDVPFPHPEDDRPQST